MDKDLKIIDDLFEEIKILDRLKMNVYKSPYHHELNLFHNEAEAFSIREHEFFNFIELEIDTRRCEIAHTLDKMAGYTLFKRKIAKIDKLKIS